VRKSKKRKNTARKKNCAKKRKESCTKKKVVRKSKNKVSRKKNKVVRPKKKFCQSTDRTAHRNTARTVHRSTNRSRKGARYRVASLEGRRKLSGNNMPAPFVEQWSPFCRVRKEAESTRGTVIIKYKSYNNDQEEDSHRTRVQAETAQVSGRDCSSRPCPRGVAYLGILCGGV